MAWLPYGINHFIEFIYSYVQSDAGYAHELIIAFNGLDEQHENIADEYIQYLKDNNIHNYVCYYYDKGLDIEIYKKLGAILTNDFILFFNSYSKIERSNWLLSYVQNYNESIGLIGATGSYAGFISIVNSKILQDLFSKGTLISKINLLKYGIKLNILYNNKFDKFPNPHIRTNAFFIKRTLLNEILMVKPRNKTHAYLFENGGKSLTRQVLGKGLQCVIIDKYGKSYLIKDWPHSGIFWQSSQENLLISDNQTRKYLSANDKERAQLRKYAWGTK